MTPLTSFDHFQPLYEQGIATAITATIVGDLETPVAAFLKLRQAVEGPAFLLESVEGGTVRGRYSMIGLAPDLVWQCQNGMSQTNSEARFQENHFIKDEQPPLQSLRALIKESALQLEEDAPPMAAGLFGYLGYDMVRLMEHLPDVNPDVLQVPDAVLVRPTMMVVFDAVKDLISLVTPVRPKQSVTAKQAYETAIANLEEMISILDQPVPVLSFDAPMLALGEPVSNTSPSDYETMVNKAKDYIKAGDIFQVVLSQRFDTDFPLPAFSLYRSLRRVNPSPFLCYLDFVDYQIVCSSPEILVRMRDNKVSIRPIAGTRPRGATPEKDQALAHELLNDPKERAEHLMLLDLGRNDAGRVSELGSVSVTESFFLEYYSQVMHIVSNVEGTLRSDCDALDALVAGFPAGTVSGAPKVRAMEIIDELEKDKRSPYAGCIGYFGANGEMDSCIVLRTAIVKDGKMSVQAGAGIVYDSVSQAEQQECVNKAKALFRAADDAIRFATQGKQ